MPRKSRCWGYRSTKDTPHSKPDNVAALLEKLARTRGIHIAVTDDATMEDVLEAVRIIGEHTAHREWRTGGVLV